MRQSQILLFFILIFGLGCTASKKATTPKTKPLVDLDYQFPYDLQEPDVTFDLPKSLQEVSGIAFTEGNQEIVAIQDEEGILFFLDKKTGEVLREQRFHKNGDYEDIEVVGESIFVIKSNGSLYQLEKTNADTLARTKYKIAHHKEHDMEGLCYDKVNNRLLVACKGILSQKKEYKLHKGLCAFNLSSKTLEERPAFSVSLQAIEHYIKEKGTLEMRSRFEKIMAENEGMLGFAPSAVAIHPITDNIYISSSKGKALIVISQTNQVLHIEKLNKEIHQQPEGMLFDLDGTLYISNEGKKNAAKIYTFRQKGK